MDDDELLDLLTSIEEQVPTEEKPGWFEREASELDPGEFGRASLLVAAGEHWQMRGAYDDARRCFLLALEDGGESRSDPIANLLSVALDEGDESAVHEYDAELRQLARHDAVSSSSCHLVAEAYEQHGHPRLALRWCNIPFTHDEPEDDPIDHLLLMARRRVRAALGLAPDQLDELVAER